MSSVNEEYFVNWKDHGSNFSLSFNDLLHGSKLVDVQLVAEGHLIGAHRLVLSAMSPYFCNMFGQMPANQQAFVFLKDITKQTMEQLITFIYRGEVNVKKDYLDEFMNAAQALNIKGLADGDFSQSFVQKQSFSTLAGPSFDGSTYQTPDFNHPLGSAGVQYQCVQRSAQFTQPQQLMNENQVNCGIDFEQKNQMTMDFGYNSNYDQNYADHNGSCNSSMNHYDDTSFDQWESEIVTGFNDNNNSRMKTTKTGHKRAKQEIETSEYDIEADVRINAKGGENLYHANNKFSKIQKPNTNGQQRWQCTKANSKKCRAMMSTMSINGIMMMKVITDTHTHLVE